MKFTCTCGQVIRDGSDFIPYKARFVADEDMEELCVSLETLGTELIAKVVQEPAPERDLSAYLEEFKRAVYRNIYEFANRVIYQCLSCGRIFFERSGDNVNLHGFQPDDADWLRLLGSKHGEQFHPWRTDLVGSWDETSNTGELWWYPPPGEKGGYERYSTSESLERRYMELFESLSDNEHLKGARLGIKDKSGRIRDIHSSRGGSGNSAV